MDTQTQSFATLVCPKCQGAMRTYERSGITVDQCPECRGVFLDRGELEQLLDAEATAQRGAGRSAQADDPRAIRESEPREGRGSHKADDPDDDDRHGPDQGGARDTRRTGGREGRFSSLLDMFGGGD
jgi:Zn-finger nucleic acid-binding protein